jgi:hypothetical protein
MTNNTYVEPCGRSCQCGSWPVRYRRRHHPRLRSRGGEDSEPITMGWTTGPATTSLAGTGGGSGGGAAALSAAADSSANRGSNGRSAGSPVDAASTSSGPTSSGPTSSGPTSSRAGERNGSGAGGGPASIGTGLGFGEASCTSGSVGAAGAGVAARCCPHRGAWRSRRSMKGLDGKAQFSAVGPRSGRSAVPPSPTSIGGCEATAQCGGCQRERLPEPRRPGGGRFGGAAFSSACSMTSKISKTWPLPNGSAGVGPA